VGDVQRDTSLRWERVRFYCIYRITAFCSQLGEGDRMIGMDRLRPKRSEWMDRLGFVGSGME
jgi:hypothetical protein